MPTFSASRPIAASSSRRLLGGARVFPWLPCVEGDQVLDRDWLGGGERLAVTGADHGAVASRRGSDCVEESGMRDAGRRLGRTRLVKLRSVTADGAVPLLVDAGHVDDQAGDGGAGPEVVEEGVRAPGLVAGRVLR